MIKRRYFIISRKYSPDRCGSNPKAQEEFRAIGRAYTILMNPGLRAKYDRVGRDRLFDEEDSDDEEEDVDPLMLYTLLFGSEKFNDHVGRLAAVTSTSVGCEVCSKLTLNQCRVLQRRRVTRLALKLAERLSMWAEDDDKEAARKQWEEEASFLCNSSYGDKLVHVIGKVRFLLDYNLATLFFSMLCSEPINVVLHSPLKRRIDAMYRSIRSPQFTFLALWNRA